VGNVSENNIIPHHPNSPAHSNYDFHVKRQPQLNLDAFEDGINIIRIGNNNIETVPAGHSKWAGTTTLRQHQQAIANGQWKSKWSRSSSTFRVQKTQS
jgi:hypothetical protein